MMSNAFSKLLIIASALAAAAVMTTQRAPSDRLAGWSKVATPNEQDLWCAAHATDRWAVSIDNGALQIAPFSGPVDHGPVPPFPLDRASLSGWVRSARRSVPVSNGWLIGFDGGEYGGGLWWFDHQGRKRLQLSTDNVRYLTPVRGQVLAFLGLAHLQHDFGRVVIVRPSQSGAVAETLGDLPAAPLAVTVAPASNHVLVLTSEGLSAMDVGGGQKHLGNMVPPLLGPTSIVETEPGVLYVGARHFVLRVTLSDRAPLVEWLARFNCTVLDPAGEGECKCR